MGLQDIIFNYDDEKYSFLCPPCWLKTVWQFMSINSLTIKGWKQKRYIQRENDNFLIPIFIRHKVPQETLVTLNECRMYLRVETVSDITNGDGIRIAEGYYNGRRRLHYFLAKHQATERHQVAHMATMDRQDFL